MAAPLQIQSALRCQTPISEQCPIPTPAPSKYHPSFASPNADTVLRSSDDVLYRVHSYTLRTTSGFFRTMFTLPQSNEQLPCAASSSRVDEEDFIPTHEPSSTLTPLLLLLSGQDTQTPISEWTFDAIETVLTLADNWDTQGPISIIRMAITAPCFLHSDPLRVYAIASQFEWEEEKHRAERYTLQYDLLSDETLSSTLGRLSSKDVMRLLRTRKARVDRFLTLVNDMHRFSAGNNDAYDCGRCSNSKLDNQTWKDLKQMMLLEIERRPLGDTVSGYPVSGIGGDTGLGVMSWKEAELCWAATCQNPDCGSANYDRLTTLKQVKQCVDELPWKEVP